MDLDESMSRFRIASRELFNHFFRVSDPYNNDGWSHEERFSEVEAPLFKKLVLEPADLADLKYGLPHPSIRVILRRSEFAPIMINREIASGYWDFPVREVTKDARLTFITFFDWDQLDVRDNRYVRIRIDHWATQPTAEGKHALIDSQHVSFTVV